MKRKLIGIAMTMAVLGTLLFSGVAFAADEPDEVNVSWNGSGVVIGSVDTGDSESSFYSVGTSHIGQFNAIDQNNNPYSYGVDSNSFSFETSIAGTGEAEFTTTRITSKESMYGAGGQQSYSYVGVLDGTALLQDRTATNYASMCDCNYGWHANDHITVTEASAYTLARWLNSGNGDFAGLSAAGNGSADLDCMSSSANGAGVILGKGCGCYTNADFTATGSGAFRLQAAGDTSTTTAMAPGMTGASSFDFIATWLNSTFTVPDYSTTAQ